ncbi:MucR family transcriptional regulator [Aristophania vespae]|uniref:MucR family transcriptional regulator n=1 Tax=Aristophania vespae TaxID=2697033 RepID=A0A6P1NBI3_9PROT|nr:MucR family transcriptional regulator [Aristophania vespae]QHI95726.1 MucR family transcriptional regulator [Aristophania vespae]UMM63421.1 Transcriptional regulatory protein ros [Aristophania vespae]
MSEHNGREQLLQLTAEIVIAKVSNSHLPVEDLPKIIKDVYSALAGQDHSNKKSEAALTQQPAVTIRKSVYPDYIICLEDGKKLKMLKRHLKSAYGMTPEQYREKWGLPPEYPLVAPNYAKRRSYLAREIGLGRNIGSAPDGVRGARKAD